MARRPARLNKLAASGLPAYDGEYSEFDKVAIPPEWAAPEATAGGPRLADHESAGTFPRQVNPCLALAFPVVRPSEF